MRTITDVQQITNADLKLLGALPTLYDSRTTHSRDVLLDVADRYDHRLILLACQFVEAGAAAGLAAALRLASSVPVKRQTPSSSDRKADWPENQSAAS